MFVVNSNVNALSSFTTYLSLKPPEGSRSKVVQSKPVATAKNNAVVDRFEEMLLDVRSYKEQLNRRLDALAASLAALDKSIEKMASLTIKRKQHEPVILTKRRQDDAFEQLFKELYRELNKYGARRLLLFQKNVSAERALSLLRK